MKKQPMSEEKLKEFQKAWRIKILQECLGLLERQYKKLGGSSTVHLHSTVIPFFTYTYIYTKLVHNVNTELKLCCCSVLSPVVHTVLTPWFLRSCLLLSLVAP